MNICVFIIRPETLIYPYAISFPIHYFFSFLFSLFNGFSVKTNDNFYSSWPMKSTVRVKQVDAFGNTSTYLRSFTCVCSISRTPSALTFVHTNMKFRRTHIFVWKPYPFLSHRAFGRRKRWIRKKTLFKSNALQKFYVVCIVLFYELGNSTICNTSVARYKPKVVQARYNGKRIIYVVHIFTCTENAIWLNKIHYNQPLYIVTVMLKYRIKTNSREGCINMYT